MTCRTTFSCLPATSDRGAGRPPAGLFFEAEELELGCGGASGPLPCSSARAHTPRLWPSSVPFRNGAKTRPGPGDGHPLMPQHGAEPSLSSSPSDATRLWSSARISHEKTVKLCKKKRQRATCLSLLVVVVVQTVPLHTCVWLYACMQHTWLI